MRKSTYSRSLMLELSNVTQDLMASPCRNNEGMAFSFNIFSPPTLLFHISSSKCIWNLYKNWFTLKYIEKVSWGGFFTLTWNQINSINWWVNLQGSLTRKWTRKSIITKFFSSKTMWYLGYFNYSNLICTFLICKLFTF